MLRAVRFAARLGFHLDEATAEAVRRHASGITTVSAERIREELVRTLSEGGAATGARLLDALGLLDVVLPEVAAQRPHGRLEHVHRVLAHLPPGDAILGLGILLHERPPAEAASVAERLRLSRAEAERLTALVEGRAQAPGVPESDRAARLRWLRAPHTRSIIELLHLDARDDHGDQRLPEALESELESLTPDELFPPRLLTGNDLKQMGHAPGPRFRVVLDALEDAQLRREVSTKEQATALVERLLGDDN
jgi:poly(A) polymerase